MNHDHRLEIRFLNSIMNPTMESFFHQNGIQWFTN